MEKTTLETLLEILEAKKDIAMWASISPLEILDSCIVEVKDLIEAEKFPEGMMTSIRLRSGKFFDFANPNADSFTVEDTARGLATEYRFAGQTDEPYSVAQHAYICSFQPGTTYEQFERLHHDDPEFVMKDIPKPLKNLLPDYRRIEDKVTKVINEKYGIPFPLSESCHRADKEVFQWEYSGLMLKNFQFVYWDVETAERKYLERHYELLAKLKEEKNEYI